jgi:hypothetical protein
MSQLLESIQAYREPKTGAVSNMKNPPDKSADNLLLFWATLVILLPPEERDQELARLQTFVQACELEPGSLARYPGEFNPTSHDDLTGVAVAWPAYAARILAFAEAHDWEWAGNWLGRIPDFPPTIRAAAGARLGIASQIRAAIGFSWNIFEAKGETSGKCLLFLKSLALFGQGKIIDLAIAVWRLRMHRTYGSMKAVYAIYFGADHPFALFGPEDFGESRGAAQL